MLKKVSVCPAPAASKTFSVPVLLEIGLESEKTRIPSSSLFFLAIFKLMKQKYWKIIVSQQQCSIRSDKMEESVR